MVTYVQVAQCDKRWPTMRDIRSSNPTGDCSLFFRFFFIVFSFSVKKPFTKR